MSTVVEQIVTPYHQTDRFSLYEGDCRSVLPIFADCTFDSIVCDPPYELGFMGKGWDRSGIAYDVNVWRECLRVLKPGGYLLAFGGSRTYHRLACAIEDAGFEIRDQIQWLYGSGFPKSLDVARAIDSELCSVEGRHFWTDKALPKGDKAQLGDHVCEVTEQGLEHDNEGTALKPAHEPIVLARKPLIGTVAENVLQHGTGGLNIDGCRVATNDVLVAGSNNRSSGVINFGMKDDPEAQTQSPLGRWPANVIHDGSDEVVAGFPETVSGGFADGQIQQAIHSIAKNPERQRVREGRPSSIGSAARFFYCAKSSQEDRNEGLEDLPMLSAGACTDRTDGSAGLNSPRAGAGRTNGSRNPHPTVKPTELMRYVCRLVTPPGGLVLDPFCGSGSTGKAAMLEGFKFIGIELNADYCQLAQRRIEAVTRQGLLFA